MDGEHPAALFRLLGSALVEDDAIARLDQLLNGLCGQLHDDTVSRLAHDGADANTAALGKTALHQHLMVDASEEAVAEAAREALLQVEPLLPRQGELLTSQGGIKGGPIGLGCGGDVGSAP